MKKTQNEVAVGAFVLIGMLLLSLIVFFVSGVYLFRPGYSVTVSYNYVSILDKGAPVRMAGVRIGEVSSVNLIYDPEHQHTRVQVKLFIEKGIEIRRNYEFEIRGTHILSEPHIEISPQKGDEPVLKDGDVLQGVNPVPLEDLIDRAHHITAQLDEMVTELHDAVKDKEVGAAMKEIVVNMAALTKSLDKVLSGSDEDLKGTMQNIRKSTDSIQRVLDHMEQGQGTVGSLMVKDELYIDMREFMADIKKHPWKLLKKDGSGGKKFLFF